MSSTLITDLQRNAKRLDGNIRVKGFDKHTVKYLAHKNYQDGTSKNVNVKIDELEQNLSKLRSFDKKIKKSLKKLKVFAIFMAICFLGIPVYYGLRVASQNYSNLVMMGFCISWIIAIFIITIYGWFMGALLL